MGHASIQIYIGDRLKEVMPIYSDSEAMGAWVKVWMYLWDNGPTKADILERVAGKGWDRVGFLLSDHDGLLSMDWMEQKRAETELFKARQRENGSKGGRPKRKPSKAKNPGLISGKPKPNPNQSPRGEGEGESVGEGDKGKKRNLKWPKWAGEKCLSIWAEFINYRRTEKGLRYKTEVTEQRALDLACQYFGNGPDFVSGIEHTMAKTWIFPVHPSEYNYRTHAAPKVSENGQPVSTGWNPRL